MLEKIKYKNNQLYFDNVNLNDIVKNYETPIYVYSKSRIIENYEDYNKSFKKYGINNYNICYAIKSNENLSILKLLVSLGSGADTVSGYEVEKAILAGFKAEKIVYSGVGKTERELEYVISQGIGQINMESEAEFHSIRNIAHKLNKIANISIRINPDINAHTHEKISTGKKENKFGITIEVANKIIEEAKKDNLLNFKGLSVHIGSQILNVNDFELTFQYLKKLYENYPEFTTIDLGGGLGIEYRENDKTPSHEEYVKLISKYFKDTNLQILIEPGRSIVGDAGIFLSRITYIKRTEINNFIILDGGMNNLLRPALYDAYHHPMLVNINSNEKETYNIVGPICESSDVFVKSIELNKAEQGNYIAFLSAGAYGRSMASIYNLHDIAGEIMIDNGKIIEIRKPINFKDLLKFEEL